MGDGLHLLTGRDLALPLCSGSACPVSNNHVQRRHSRKESCFCGRVVNLITQLVKGVRCACDLTVLCERRRRQIYLKQLKGMP